MAEPDWLPLNHIQLLRQAIRLAGSARADGNHPFGAMLATPAGRIMAEAKNTVVTDSDVTGHAETNLVRQVWSRFSSDSLADSILVSSTEPCPMCAGAIFWSGIGAVIYALSEKRFYAHIESEGAADTFLVGCRDIFRKASRQLAVAGPYLEDEALEPHRGFWK